jgi:hypothetical protein
MKSRFFGVLALAASAWLTAAVARPGTLVLTPVPETEPNNTPATATPLILSGGCQVASGAISPGSDLDYYSFTAAPGTKVWATTDTGASGPLAVNRDSILTLFAPDGVTVLETDDDDAPGNNGDATVESFQASAIAGKTLTAGGTYFLRVESFNAQTISAYKLFVVVTSTSTAESEPNDLSSSANTLVTAVSPIGVRTAAIGTVGDTDFYAITLAAPATFFISTDGDPERNGSGTDLVVDLIGTNGTTVLFSDDNTDEVGSPAPPAESFTFNIATPGTYFVRVTGFSGGKFPVTGTYSIMVAACGLPAGPTPTPTLTVTPGGPTATPTATRTATPPGGGGTGPTADIPTLSFPMLLLMGLALIASAFVLVRRL